MSIGIDYQFLTSYGFFKFYPAYRDRLLTIARDSYRDLQKFTGICPQAWELWDFLETDLIISTIFADIVADLCVQIGMPGPRDSYWPDFFAPSVARVLIDSE